VARGTEQDSMFFTVRKTSAGAKFVTVPMSAQNLLLEQRAETNDPSRSVIACPSTMNRDVVKGVRVVAS